MIKILSIFLFLLITFNAKADSLGVNKTINDYLDNGYELQSISVIKEDKFLYNLIHNNSEEKMFEPKLVSCVFDVNTQIAECFKP